MLTPQADAWLMGWVCPWSKLAEQVLSPQYPLSFPASSKATISHTHLSPPCLVVDILWTPESSRVLFVGAEHSTRRPHRHLHPALYSGSSIPLHLNFRPRRGF